MVRVRDMTLDDLPRDIRKKLPRLKYSEIVNGKVLPVIDKAEIHLDYGEGNEEIKICYILAAYSYPDWLYYSTEAQEIAEAKEGKVKKYLTAKLSVKSRIFLSDVATYISLKPRKIVGLRSLIEQS